MRDAVPADARLAARLADRSPDALLDAPLAEEHRPPPICLGPPTSVADLVRIATDWQPAAADHAPDIVFGPRAPWLDRWSITVAVAWAALFPGDFEEHAPIRRSTKDKALPLAVRERLRATLRAPPSVFEVVGTEPLVLLDRLGIGASAPRGPVVCPEPPALGAGPLAPGDEVVGRVVFGEHVDTLVAPIRVPRRALDPVRRWVSRAGRVLDPDAATIGDALRAAGYGLPRRLLAGEP